jgi:hypothetical protein
MWPWTRTEEQIKREAEKADRAHARLGDEIDRLEKILDRWESRLEEGIINGKR